MKVAVVPEAMVVTVSMEVGRAMGRAREGVCV